MGSGGWNCWYGDTKPTCEGSMLGNQTETSVISYKTCKRYINISNECITRARSKRIRRFFVLTLKKRLCVERRAGNAFRDFYFL